MKTNIEKRKKSVFYAYFSNSPSFFRLFKVYKQKKI